MLLQRPGGEFSPSGAAKKAFFNDILPDIRMEKAYHGVENTLKSVGYFSE